MARTTKERPREGGAPPGPNGAAAGAGIGVFGATMLVMGNMIGSGVFTLPSNLAKYGVVSIIGWLVTGIGALFLALVFSRLARGIPRTGGPYAYSKAAFGDFMGFWIAWGYWIAVWAGNAAIAISCVGYIGYFVPFLQRNNAVSTLCAIGLVWLLSCINAYGVKQGSLVTNITAVVKLAVLVGIGVVGIILADWGNFEWNPSGVSFFVALGSTLTLTLWAFIGLESATVPAGDVKDPDRTIPLSTVVGTLGALGVYVIGTIAVMGSVPLDELSKSAFPFAEAARNMFGSTGGTIVAIGAIIGTFGALNGWILLQGQVPFAAANDKVFPKRFAAVSRHNVPIFGLIVSSLLITILMLIQLPGGKGVASLFEVIILIATFCTIIPYVFSAGAQLFFLATDRAHFSGRRFGIDMTIAVLAFLYTLYAVYGAGFEYVTYGLILLLVGIPVYMWVRWKKPAPADWRSAEPSPHAGPERIEGGGA